MKLNGQQIFEHMANVSDELILDSLPPVGGGAVISTRRKRPYSPMRAFFESGWFVAILCAVVSLSVVGAMVWAGRQKPGVVPPTGATEQESGFDSLPENVHVEKETAIEVVELQKVVISTENCLGQPYNVSFYLPYQYKNGYVFPSNITLEDSSHYIESSIAPPTVDQLLFNSSEYIISLYREYINNATIHVGFDATRYQCTACHSKVPKPIFIDDHQVVVTTRTCTGQSCDITCEIFVSSHQIINDNLDGYPLDPSGLTFYQTNMILSLPSDAAAVFTDRIVTHQNKVSFADRELALNYAKSLVDTVVHVGYDKEHRLCTVCGEMAPVTVEITGDKALVTTRDCQGNVCEVSYNVYKVMTPQLSSRYYEIRLSLASEVTIDYGNAKDPTSESFISLSSLATCLQEVFSQAIVHKEYNETTRICTACDHALKSDLEIDKVQHLEISYCGSPVEEAVIVTDSTVIYDLLSFMFEATEKGRKGESTMGHYGVLYYIEIVYKDGTPPSSFTLWNRTHYSTPQHKDEEGYAYFFTANMKDMLEYLNEKYPEELWHPD